MKIYIKYTKQKTIDLKIEVETKDGRIVFDYDVPYNVDYSSLIESTRKLEIR